MKATVKLALLALAAGLIVSLTANAYLYAAVNSGLPAQVNELQNQIAALESQTVNLQAQLDAIQSRGGYWVTALGATYTRSLNASGWFYYL
jgi:peptidoglycan hydrolase CwlO-like protein